MYLNVCTRWQIKIEIEIELNTENDGSRGRSMFLFSNIISYKIISTIDNTFDSRHPIV